MIRGRGDEYLKASRQKHNMKLTLSLCDGGERRRGGREDAGAMSALVAGQKGGQRAGSRIQIPPPLNWITRRAAVRNMNMAMICGLVNPFITNNNVTARGRSTARGREAGEVHQRGPMVGRGVSGGALFPLGNPPTISPKTFFHVS